MESQVQQSIMASNINVISDVGGSDDINATETCHPYQNNNNHHHHHYHQCMATPRMTAGLVTATGRISCVGV
ncbi:hypothetical protein BLA29_012350, partial [Euroglyphus maynei]